MAGFIGNGEISASAAYTRAGVLNGSVSRAGSGTLTAQASVGGVTFTDNFNRADGALGANWVNTGATNLIIVSQQVNANTAGTYSRWVTDAPSAGTQFSQQTYLGAPFAAVCVAMPSYVGGTGLSSTGSFYVFRSNPNGAPSGIQLVQKTALSSSSVTLTSSTTLLTVGDVMRLEWDGTTLTCFINGGIIMQAIPGTPITGQFGVGMGCASATFAGAALDDWSGGVVAATAFSGNVGTSGTGTLSGGGGAGFPGRTGATSGTGTITGTSSATPFSGSGATSGSGTISATGKMGAVRTAATSGTGTLTGAGSAANVLAFSGLGNAVGSGTLTGAAGVTGRGSGNLTGRGALTAPAPPPPPGHGLSYVEVRLYTDATNYVLCPSFTTMSFDSRYNDVGSLNMDYPVEAAVALGITDQKVVGIVMGFNNGNVREVERYIIDSTNDDKVIDGQRFRAVSGRSMLAVLEDSVVYPENWPVTTPSGHSFANNNFGTIFKTLLTRAQDGTAPNRRGCYPLLTSSSFDGVLSSAGKPWASIHTQVFSTGTTYLSILQDFMGRGLVDAQMVGWDLQLYNGPVTPDDGTTWSYELGQLIDIGTVEVRPAQNVTEMSVTTNSAEACTAVLIEGEAGTAVERKRDPTVYANYLAKIGRRRERSTSQGGVADAGILAILGDAELATFGKITSEETVGLTDSSIAPFNDFNVSDRVWVRFDTDQPPVQRRVFQIAVSIDESGSRTIGLTLNSIIYDADIRLQRKIEAYSGSGSVYGSLPAPVVTVSDKILPNPPVGLLVTSSTFVDRVGLYQAAFLASWGPPTTNVDGTPIQDLASYAVRWKYSTDTIWSAALPTSDTSLGYSPVSAGATINVQVRSYDTSNNASAWSATATHTVVSDTTPPSQPSIPVASNGQPFIKVAWDGLDSLGGQMPPDVRLVEVWQSQVTGFTPGSANTEKVGQFPPGGGVITVRGFGIGVTTYIRLVAVDNATLRSNPSGQASAIVLASDGIAPTVSPIPTVTSGLGNLYVKWTPVANADFLNYEVHVSNALPFVPLPGASNTLVVRTAGSFVSVNSLPGGQPLAYGTQYYFSIIARDADGSAPPSAVVGGFLAKLNQVDLNFPASGVYYQATQPTGGTYALGDTWFNTSDGFKISVFDGTNWVLSQLNTNALADLAITNAKIANLDGGKINAQTINTTKLSAGAISDNLVPNGSFEDWETATKPLVWNQDSAGVYAGATYAKVIDASRISGTSSARMTAATGFFARMWSASKIPCVPGDEYVTTFSVASSLGWNLHPNPSVETDMDGWVANDNGTVYQVPTLTRSNARSFSGTWSINVAWTGTTKGAIAGVAVDTTPGVVYTASGYVFVPTGIRDVRLEILGNSASAVTTVKNAWVRLSQTFTATDTSSFVGFGFAGAGTAGNFNVDAVMVEEGSILTAYSETPITDEIAIGLMYFDAGGGLLANPVENRNVNPVPTRVSTVSSAPDGAVTMSPAIATLSGANGESLTVDDCEVRRLIGGANIADASIFAAHIQDAAISDAKIGSLTADKIVGGQLTADVILAGSGGFSTRTDDVSAGIDIDSTGLFSYDSEGVRRVEMPTDANLPDVFRGDAEIDALKVNLSASLNDTSINPGHTMRLENVVGAPPNAPTVSIKNVTQAFTLSDGDWTTRKGWTSDGVNWFMVNTTTKRVEKYDATGKRINRSPVLSIVPDEVGSIVYLPVTASNGTTGGWLYALLRDAQSTSRATGWKVYRLDPDTLLVSTPIANWLGSPVGWPSIGRDYVTGEILITSSRSDDHVQFNRYLWNNGIGTSHPVVVGPTYGSHFLTTSMYGPFDFGANRYIYKNSAGFDTVWVTMDPTTNAEDPAHFWDVNMGGPIIGLHWDGTHFVGFGQDGQRRTYESGNQWTNPNDSRWFAATTYYNADTDQETTRSPYATFTMKKRARLTVFGSSLPSGVTESRVYLDRGTPPV